MSIEQITPAAEAPATTSLKRAVLYTRVSTSRQASKNGEAEGYSIPAQRTACQRKAQELGAEIVEEFVDAGASARSADREGLQEKLSYVKQGNVDYVLVHKLERLGRDRADDVAILAAIQAAGAVLVSATEQIDETPPGMLMHGIMATMAKFYSRNLANEAKKGIAQKAKNGGTHGVAPIGYVNTNTRIEGREIKGVAVDVEKAELIRWAFRTYATGDLSISMLRDELEERGLRSRKTAKYVGTPLTISQVHRMLSNPYYIGKVKHREAIYDGIHEPLIDDDTWYTVQEGLAGRRIAGDRSWRHTHYLKGSLSCHRCGGGVGFGYSQGRGGFTASSSASGGTRGAPNVTCRTSRLTSSRRKWSASGTARCNSPLKPLPRLASPVVRSWKPSRRMMKPFLLANGSGSSRSSGRNRS